MQGKSSNLLQLEHHFACPPAKVWRAWTDPAIVKMWFGSDANGTGLDAEMNVEIGGSFKVRFANSDGTEYTAKGIYKEIELNKKLVFTWGWADRAEVVEAIALELKPENEGTLMLFEHQDIDRNTAHNYSEGWRSTFQKLEKALNRLYNADMDASR
jgi:uncharacterized protein YndB with AHSA1/START domain